MLLNAPSVVAVVLALAQGALGAVVATASTRALLARRRARTVEEADLAEVLALQPVLPALALFVVSLAAWPLLVEVLRSYVPLWETVMCVDGVTRIGRGAYGVTRFLPPLVSLLLVTKPVLPLLGGVWLVVHSVTRRSSGRPGALGPAALAALGSVALADAAAEVSYLLIPKTEDLLTSGCCTTTSWLTVDDATTWLERLLPGIAPGTAVAAAIAAAVVLAAALATVSLRSPTRPPLGPGASLGLLAAGAVLAATAQHVALGVVSPALHGVSTLRCGWCLLELTRFGGAAMGLLAFSLGCVLLVPLAAARERRVGVAVASTSRAVARLALLALLASGALVALESAFRP